MTGRDYQRHTTTKETTMSNDKTRTITLTDSKEDTMPAYTTDGPVRGDCGHHHRTIEGAVRCLRDDRAGCARQGGYSDRNIVRADGEPLDEWEHDEIQTVLDRLDGWDQ